MGDVDPIILSGNLILESPAPTKSEKDKQQEGFLFDDAAPDVPSVLVELGFLSNERDARALLSGTHRTKVAEALYRAVDEYFNPVE